MSENQDSPTSGLTRRGLITSALTLAVSVAVPSWAAAPARAATNRELAEEPGSYCGPFGFTVPTYQTTVPGESVETFRTDIPVAPGIVLTSFRTFGRTGWMRCHVLNADLSEPTVGVDVLNTTLTDQQTVSQAAATRKAIAAVNGDYFDITQTNAPIGSSLATGKLQKATDVAALLPTVGVDRIARFADLMLDGTLTVDGAVVAMNDLNSLGVPVNGITVFTPEWGHGERTTISVPSTLIELVVSNGQVIASNTKMTNTPIPADGFIVAAAGSAIAKLAGAKSISISFQPKTDSPVALQMAIGSDGEVLIRDGVIPTFATDTYHTEAKPRTALGWLDGGKRMLLVAIDGSANFSAGVSFAETAAIMKRLGASDAYMLDGGGSTELVSRHPGDSAVSVVNTPSDGNERLVSGSVGLFGGAKGSGELRGLDLRPQADRVIPGLTMDVAAAGYDETWSPVAIDRHPVTWSSVPGKLGTTTDGIFRATKSGAGNLTAHAANASGEHPLRVLGKLYRLEFSEKALTIESGATASVTIVGFDADGFDSPVNARDVALSYDKSVLTVTVQDDGSVSITSTATAGTTAVITATVQSISATLAVTVGLNNSSLEEFDGTVLWTAASAQGTASVAFVPAPERPGATATNEALQLSYDFTGKPSTSAAYAVSPTNITLPIGTKRLSLWVNGDGRGHWLRAQMRSQGTTNVPFTFANVVDWVGWREVIGDIPAGFSDPITLQRVYIAETSQTNKNAGKLEFDALTALVGQAAGHDAPPQPDPYVLEQTSLPTDRWTFAVLSDLHISASQGLNSFSGRQAVTALQQVVASKPDFILINGDFVDNNTPADFQLANQLLSTYVPASLPVYWTPGNHEAGLSATGGLDAFLSVTGRPNRQVVDHKGTRFILLDSHTGDMRTADWSQVPDLKAELDKAATDSAVTGVVVSFHHPLEDPTGAASSQISDQLEAELLGQWLADFRESSGKPVALFTGHAHTASVSRANGVLKVTTPAVGKTPYSSPDQGGFFGWMHVAVDASPAKITAGLPSRQTRDWLVAESHPIIDKIALTAPANVAVGSNTTIAASGFTTEFGLEFPLRFPASVLWSGTNGVVIAQTPAQLTGAKSSSDAIAVLDLGGANASLTALRPGNFTLAVASGGLSASAEITIASN